MPHFWVYLEDRRETAKEDCACPRRHLFVIPSDKGRLCGWTGRKQVGKQAVRIYDSVPVKCGNQGFEIRYALLLFRRNFLCFDSARDSDVSYFSCRIVLDLFELLFKKSCCLDGLYTGFPGKIFYGIFLKICVRERVQAFFVFRQTPFFLPRIDIRQFNCGTISFSHRITHRAARFIVVEGPGRLPFQSVQSLIPSSRASTRRAHEDTVCPSAWARFSISFFSLAVVETLIRSIRLHVSWAFGLYRPSMRTAPVCCKVRQFAAVYANGGEGVKGRAAEWKRIHE